MKIPVEPQATPEPTAKREPIPADLTRHPPGCPDPDWCSGNGLCYWDCWGRWSDE